ncbi:MAG: hypothetical protein JNJ53_02455 [Rhizobiales bacterium]|nr:hypothetical protein [Hyphomicrobiales bacterium]
MMPVDDIRTMIGDALERNQAVDTAEVALLAQKLHPQYSITELTATVTEQRSLMRELKLWPKAGPHSL